MAQINYNDIQDINVPWENYAGSSVEKFIKGELKNRCGYLYRSRTKEGDYYYLYGFTDFEQYEAWADGDSTIVPLFKVQLPNMENDTFSVNLTTNSNTQKLVNLGDGVKINLRYTSISTNPATGVSSDTFNDGTLIISRSANGSAYEEVGRMVIQPTPHDNPAFTEYDITRYLVDGDNKLRLRVEDNVNGSVSSNITFQSIINTTLSIENATPTSQPLTALQLQYYIQGQVAKTLHIKVTQNSNTSTFDFPIGDSTYIEVPYTTPLMSMQLVSGTIEVDAWLSVDDTQLVSYHENNQFYYSDGSTADTIIILNSVSNTIVNYTNVHLFDMSLYNQAADVDIYIRSTDAQTEYLHLVLNDCQVGTVYPVYATLEVDSQLDTLQGVVSVNSATFNCEPYIITIDNSEKMSPTAGADFVLNPKVRNNSEANPAVIINSVNNAQVSSTFTGFGFINDGWLSDEDGIQVLRIPAGHNLNIGYDVLNNLANGTTFEIDFKTYNMFNDGDVILSISSQTGDNKPLGFIMNPTEAAFYTAQKQTKRDQDVIFQEGERTHLAVNIIPNLANSGLNYIRFFINGVMNREILYASTDIFKNGTLSINIGSNNTDIDIYGIRVYKTGLSASDVRQDYMSSIPTNAEKIAFKTANDILSSNGTISYDKAKVKYNTLVWTGRVPSYLTGNVEYEGKLHIDILGDNAHSGDITNLKIKGQGSSSRGYWKWNHQYDMGKLDNPSVFTNLDGAQFSGYALTDNDPAATKLVAKLNWASSMQSHKLGSTAMYTDFWKDIIGGNSITATQGYEKVRVSVHEKPFLYFVKENDNAQPVFYGLMTFGSAKYDKPTFGYDKNVFPDYLILEGSDNGMPLTLRQVPWLDDEVVYNDDEEYYEYAGQGNLDYGMGNQNMLHYFKDAFNFSYLHSPRLKPYTNDSELTDASYQYWNTTTKNVKRYDWISESWVDAGLTKTTACEYHAATQEDVDNHLANKVGEKVVDVYPVYEALNLETQTGLLRTNYSSDAEYNAAVISWRVNDFKNRISTYYNVNDVIYSMVFLKLVGASDNWCKNTYEYLDPVTHKICMAQDDMDTLFLTDNVGRKTKPYYVEEHDIDPENKPYFNGDTNNFFCLMEKAYESEEKNMMRQVFNNMRSKYGTPKDCIEHYFFDVQEYFPAVAYNETARILYEEASVAESQGIYDNATPPITQSLGNQLEAEKQWWNRRIPYMQSWSSADPFYTRSTVEPNIMFRSMTTILGNNPTYQFSLTPWQWLYPKVGTGQYLSTDAQRVPSLTAYNTVTLATDGNTDTYIYGSDYYTSFGEFGGVSLSEAFRLNGKRLLEFSADSRNVASYEFRPRSMTIDCPALQTLSLYGCSSLSGILDLSGCLKLVSVDLRGTSLSSVVLPETDTLTTVYLPDLTSITVVNCPNISTFNVAGYTNLLSLTTDNSALADYIISNVNTLSVVDLRKINIVTTSNNVNNYVNLLTNENSRCTITGSIYLATALTNQQIEAIEDKFGQSVWDSNNSFYISYIYSNISYVNLSYDSGYGSLLQHDSIKINVETDGNNVKSYSWTLNNTIDLTTVKKRNSIVINTSTFNEIEEFTVTYTIITTNNDTISNSINVTACYLDFTLNNQVLMNSTIDVYVGNSDNTWTFKNWTLNENIDYSGTIDTLPNQSPGLSYFGYDSSVGYNVMVGSGIGVDENITQVYGGFNIDGIYNVFVPFSIKEHTIPAMTINTISDVPCKNGVGTLNVTWTLPTSYANNMTVDSQGIYLNAVPYNKRTISNVTNSGCRVSFTDITSDISTYIGVTAKYDNNIYETSVTGMSNTFTLKYVELMPCAKIKYNITTAGTNQILSSDAELFLRYIGEMTVDGTNVTPTKTYDFQTTGTHIVEVYGSSKTQKLAHLLDNISTATEVEFSNFTELGYNICYRCTNLTKVTIRGDLQTISNGAFSYCANLNEIRIQETSVCPTINSYTFQGVATGGKLYYPQNVDFSSWLRVSSYYLGYYDWNTTTVTIDNYTYKLCDKGTPQQEAYILRVLNKTILTDVVIPNQVTYGGKSYVITALGDAKSQSNYGPFTDSTNMTSITIPNTVKFIGTKCFSGCTSLVSVEIPGSVSQLYETFKDCTNLTNVILNEGITKLSAPFRNCSALKSVEIPSSVTDLGGGWSSKSYAIGAWGGIEQIIFKPNSKLETLSTYTFYASKLKSIVIPNSVKTYFSSVFERCEDLTSVTLSNSATSLSNDMFDGCKSLTSITIPSTVTNIGRIAFGGCINLSTIIINRSTAPTVYTPQSSDSSANASSWGYTAENAAGSNNRGTGNNILYVPADATGYDTIGWTNCLLNSSFSDFTISKTL